MEDRIGFRQQLLLDIFSFYFGLFGIIDNWRKPL